VTIAMPTYTAEINMPPSQADAFIIGDATDGKLGTGKLASNGFDGVGSLVDVTDQVVSGSTTIGGASAPLWAQSVGTCSLVINDNGHDFDPSNEASPYTTPVRTYVSPRQALFVTGPTIDSISERIFTGKTRQFTPTVLPGDRAAVVAITGEDLVSDLAAKSRLAESAVGSGESASDRFLRVMQSVDWDGDIAWTPSAGGADMDATTLGGSPWDEIVAAANADYGPGDWFGEVTMDQEGVLTFRSPTSIDSSRALPDRTFSDDGVNIPYASVRIIADDKSWVSAVEAARPGGVTTRTVRNKAVAQYGERLISRTSLPVEDDQEAANWATSWTEERSRPVWSFDDLVVDARYSQEAQDACFVTRLGDAIRIKMTRADATVADRECIVRRITHKWSHRSQTWTTTFGLQANWSE